MLRVHEKSPSFIQPLWIRSCIPTDLLCANWGIKKKKSSDAAQRWGWRWCGGSGDPAGVEGGNFQWATGELKRTQKGGGRRGEAEEPEVCAPEPGDGGGYDRVSSPGPRAAAAAAGLLANTGDGRSEWVCWLFVFVSVCVHGRVESRVTSQLLRSDNDENLRDKQCL